MSHNIMAFFRDIIRDQRPDLVVWEEPVTPEAWKRIGASMGRPQNGESLLIQNSLAFVLSGLCRERDIAFEELGRQKVLKHFTGRSSHSSSPGAGDGRKNGKLAVLAQARRLGLIPPNCTDDDQGDAVAMHDYACAMWGRRHAQMTGLFDEGRLRHG